MPPDNRDGTESEANSGHTKEPEAFRASILVVDDEPAFCFAIAEILSRAGYRVREAHSVQQAFESLEAEVPDLILTDIMMPGVDGFTFLRRLNSNPASAAVPKIAVSAKALAADVKAASLAGADAHLAKPFSSQQLQEVIRPFLESPESRSNS